jgi:hypothetical protein
MKILVSIKMHNIISKFLGAFPSIARPTELAPTASVAIHRFLTGVVI